MNPPEFDPPEELKLPELVLDPLPDVSYPPEDSVPEIFEILVLNNHLYFKILPEIVDPNLALSDSKVAPDDDAKNDIF